MTIHSSILAGRVPCIEEPGRLQSMGSQRVGHDRITSTFTLFSDLLSWNFSTQGTEGQKEDPTNFQIGRCSLPTKDRKTKMALKFLTTTLEGRRQGSKAFKILRENYFQLKLYFQSNYWSAVQGGRKKNLFQACSLSTMSPSHYPF